MANRHDPSQNLINQEIVKQWFVEHYKPLLIKGCCKFREESAVKDILMETFYKLLSNKSEQNYSEIKSPFSFIWRVFYNSYIDFLRKNKQLQKQTVELDENAYSIIIDGNEEKHFLKGEFEEYILPKLNERQKACFLLYLKGVSYNDITLRLDITLNQVNHSLRSAKEVIRLHFRQ